MFCLSRSVGKAKVMKKKKSSGGRWTFTERRVASGEPISNIEEQHLKNARRKGLYTFSESLQKRFLKRKKIPEQLFGQPSVNEACSIHI